MDPVFHFCISFAGGYIILKELRRTSPVKKALVLSFLSILIDADHIFGYIVMFLLTGVTSIEQLAAMKPLFFHNVFVVLLLLLFGFISRGEKKIYGYALSVMIFGHLLFDMVNGMGVMLFFPFSRNYYLIPLGWRVGFFGNSYLLDTYGIAIALYFIAVFLAVFALKRSTALDKSNA